MPSIGRILVLALAFVGVVALVALFFTALPPGGFDPASSRQISINELAAGIKDGTVRRVSASGDGLRVEYLDKTKAISRKDSGAPLVPQLQAYGVTADQLDAVSIVFADPPQPMNWRAILAVVGIPAVLFSGWTVIQLLRRLEGVEWELRAIREELRADRTADAMPLRRRA